MIPCIRGGPVKETVKAYIDLTRIHFGFVWPLVCLSGLMLAFHNYGGFSWSLTVRAIIGALLGFEAGFVLNDYIDRDIDKKDVEFNKLTPYWRVFNKRPLASGLIAPRTALLLFITLVICTSVIILTLPFPHNLYIMGIMGYSFFMESFYQVKKRHQNFPWAQLIGRTDFTFFPVAGYLCYGHLDKTALLFAFFFYPWVIAHLGLNDIIDIRNDEARNLKTIAVLYGTQGTARWILLFTIIHLISAPFFLMELGSIARGGFILAFFILIYANYRLIKEKSPERGLSVLPLFHVTLIIYSLSIILDFALHL